MNQFETCAKQEFAQSPQSLDHSINHRPSIDSDQSPPINRFRSITAHQSIPINHRPSIDSDQSPPINR
jgi:hypothetical protein